MGTTNPTDQDDRRAVEDDDTARAVECPPRRPGGSFAGSAYLNAGFAGR